MLYLTMNYRSEVIKRFQNYKSLKLNLLDVQAQLSVVRERDSRTRVKAASECTSSNTSSTESHPAIKLSMMEDTLIDQELTYQLIIKDYEKGYRLLSDQQKQVLHYRYILHMSIDNTADKMKVGTSTIKRLTDEALRILESQMTKI